MPTESEEIYGTEEYEEKLFTGTTISEEIIVDSMFMFYRSQFEDGKSPIEYLEEGGEARNLLEAYAIPLKEYFSTLNKGVLIQFLPHSEGDFLDILGGDILRESGGKSSGYLLFYLPDNMVKDYDIVIPSYFLASTDNEESLEFETITEVTLPAGTNSILVPAKSLYVGSEYNTVANTINILEEDLDELEVINPEAFIGGTDNEDDEHYRARLLEDAGIPDFGSEDWFKDEALTIEGVNDVLIVNQYKGTNTIGIIIAPSVESIINIAQDYFNQGSKRPGGTWPVCLGAGEEPIDVTIEIVPADGYTPEEAISNVESSVINFFGKQKINQQLIENDLRQVIFHTEGINFYDLITPTNDLTPSEHAIFTLGNLSIAIRE